MARQDEGEDEEDEEEDEEEGEEEEEEEESSRAMDMEKIVAHTHGIHPPTSRRCSVSTRRRKPSLLCVICGYTSTHLGLMDLVSRKARASATHGTCVCR